MNPLLTGKKIGFLRLRNIERRRVDFILVHWIVTEKQAKAERRLVRKTNEPSLGRPNLV